MDIFTRLKTVILSAAVLLTVFGFNAGNVFAGSGSISASKTTCYMATDCGSVTISWSSQQGNGSVYVTQNNTQITGGNQTSGSNFPVTLSQGSNVFRLFVAGSNQDDNTGNSMSVTVNANAGTDPNATPTPAPTSSNVLRYCNETCGTGNNVCASGFTCYQGQCRNATFPDRSDCYTGTYRYCNETCDGGNKCGSGLSCINGTCRNPSYPTQNNCAAPSTTTTSNTTSTSSTASSNSSSTGSTLGTSTSVSPAPTGTEENILGASSEATMSPEPTQMISPTTQPSKGFLSDITQNPKNLTLAIVALVIGGMTILFGLNALGLIKLGSWMGLKKP